MMNPISCHRLALTAASCAGFCALVAIAPAAQGFTEEDPAAREARKSLRAEGDRKRVFDARRERFAVAHAAPQTKRVASASPP